MGGQYITVGSDAHVPEKLCGNVDGIATMQIQNLNALVDTVRHEIIERYRPGEDDPHLKVLQAAHISDDEYFSHMVLDDLNLIIRDIREAHKKDR